MARTGGIPLRFQLVVAFVLATAVPIGVAAVGTRELVRDRYKVEFAERAERIGERIQARLRTGLRGEGERLQQFCAGDVLVDKLLTDLAAGREPDVQEHLRAAMDGRGLDTLAIVDPRGKVLGSGHLPGAVGGVDRETLALSRAPDSEDRYVVRRVRVRTDEGVRPVLVLEHSCEARKFGRRVGVVGGVHFSGVVGELLSEREDAHVFVLDESGALLSPGGPPVPGAASAAAGAFPPPASWPRLDIPLRNPDGAVAATVVVAVPDDALGADIQRLERSLAVALVTGVALALLLALLVARRIAAPLDRLARGADEIAAGNLDQQIDVRGSREVRTLVAGFNRMARDLKSTRARMLRAERVAAWREIARRIAHEIKNPLFPIQTSIETLRKTYRAQHPDFGEIFEEATSTVLEEVERVKRIVTEFSQFARMPKPRPAELSVDEVIGHIVGLFAGGPGPAVRAELPPELPRIRADREQLIQVLLNLVQNARDACENVGGAEVLVEARRSGTGVAVRVVDGGPGISEEVRARMFEPYFTTKTTGTGLGLAIVHRIVTDHGGSVDVQCPAGGGTVVTVTLTAEGPPQGPDESTGEGPPPAAGRDSVPA